jgi:hypothetical protein
MSDSLTIVLLLVTGLLMALVIMFTSSGLFAYYIVESVRRILRLRKRKQKS